MNSVSDESLPLGDPPLMEHPTPNGVTEIAQRLIPFPFTPPAVKLKDKEALSSSKDWFTKHNKKEIDQLDSLDFFASSGPQSVGVVPKLHNTSAGIEIYELPPTLSKEAFEKTEGPDNVPSTSLPVITGSVGRWEQGARNLQTNVETVQRLLETAAQRLQATELDPKGVDGKIARQSAKSNTVAAIEAFQRRSNVPIDGLIEPGSQTWQALLQAAGGTYPLPNDDFPQTYIQEISVSLDDPDHWLTLTWTGPNADSQETGPFRTSPGAGLRGLNCDDEATSRRSGSKCTPKGTYPVQGFQRRLNSDSRATYVTWFMQRRGIALHYFPIVPEYAASHGCVRIESEHVARLIRDNSLVDETQVVVSGTWTKPSKQWS